MKVTLQRVRLNQGGYDASGSYWGAGCPLFWFSFEDAYGEVSDHVRAYDRADAKAAIRLKFPKAKFYR